jgi:hypothetical protein
MCLQWPVLRGAEITQYTTCPLVTKAILGSAVELWRIFKHKGHQKSPVSCFPEMATPRSAVNTRPCSLLPISLQAAAAKTWRHSYYTVLSYAINTRPGHGMSMWQPENDSTELWWRVEEDESWFLRAAKKFGTSSNCLDGEHCFIRERAHRQLFCCCNLKVTTWSILEATELLPVTIGRTLFSLSARTGNKRVACCLL